MRMPQPSTPTARAAGLDVCRPVTARAAARAPHAGLQVGRYGLGGRVDRTRCEVPDALGPGGLLGIGALVSALVRMIGSSLRICSPRWWLAVLYVLFGILACILIDHDPRSASTSFRLPGTRRGPSAGGRPPGRRRRGPGDRQHRSAAVLRVPSRPSPSSSTACCASITASRWASSCLSQARPPGEHAARVARRSSPSRTSGTTRHVLRLAPRRCLSPRWRAAPWRHRRRPGPRPGRRRRRVRRCSERLRPRRPATCRR